MNDQLSNGVANNLLQFEDIILPSAKNNFSNIDPSEVCDDLRSLVKEENILKKQNLESFSHLLDFKEIEENAGTIQFPKFIICSDEFIEGEDEPSPKKSETDPEFDSIPRSLHIVSKNLSSLISLDTVPDTGSHITPQPRSMVSPSMMTDLKRYFDHGMSSVTDELKENLIFFLLQETALNPISGVRHSTLVKNIQALTVAFYFRENISQLLHAITTNDQFAPLRRACLEFKQQIATHLACGTAMVALGDIFDGTASDLWLSLGCLGLLVVKSKIKKQLTPTSFVSSKT